MTIHGIPPRVPERDFIWLLRPVVRLVFIAAVTAVNQIFRVVITAASPRLKVINGKFTAGIRLHYAAVLAGKVGPLTDVPACFRRNAHVRGAARLSVNSR